MTRLAYFFSFLIITSCTDVFIEDEGSINPDYPNVEKWDVLELSFQAEELEDTYSTPPLSGIFTHNGESREIDGFYDGNGNYKLRFMPSDNGLWTYKITSEIDSLNGKEGGINCIAPSSENHGKVEVQDSYHFVYSDGENYFPFGTTLYAWFWQGEDLEEQTLQTLSENAFNKVRMCVFPKNYKYCQNEPPMYPFLRGSDGQFDYNKINYEYFQHYDRRIAQLLEMGIEADVILFHPYDYVGWGFSRMGEEANKKYLRYIMARLGAYRNIWWSMANEYQLMDDFSEEDWEELGQFVKNNDPYHHLISIHNANSGFYDFTRPWITHASIQVKDVEPLNEWREDYGKPIVADEVGYEGNIPDVWGNLSAEELMYKFWVATVRGGYVSHGETFQHPEDILWWAKGGTLYGETPERIAFLKGIVEEIGAGLESKDEEEFIGENGSYILHYLGEENNEVYNYKLPDNAAYQVDLIDTWNMEIQSIGEFTNEVKMDLPSKKYLAVRMRRK
ncbi:DUF5605 domain-containing protein [Flexithrix dorotheae]|uniref:DUF5605 domain-containing protein n=1 Tax=Flexithrix dorotheae TaxID=70993 RepID=UPI00037A0E68|nr:DUF5605 domain-containing protein [Flexithrix dorotheae]